MKDNLVSLGVISAGSLLCPSGCGKKKLLIIFLWNPLSLIEFGLLSCICWESFVFNHYMFAFLP